MAEKYAVLINSDTEEVGQTANGLEYALDLYEGGNDVSVFFDGSATQWISELNENPDHPVNDYYEEALEEGLVGGVCGYCADAFGAYEDAEEAGVDRLGGRGEHGPDISGLAAEGYELLTIG